MMMQRYFTTTANLKSPALVGFNVWGSPNDYRFFRYAFASCLLGNGHFSFTDDAAGYSSVPWFDEYEVAFGAPLDAPTLTAMVERRVPAALRECDGAGEPERRRAHRGSSSPGWRRLLARQDPVTNDGSPVTTLTLGPKEGIVLCGSSAFSGG